jgi:hypothetical protein
MHAPKDGILFEPANLPRILRLLLSSTMSAEQRWQRFLRDAAGRRLDRQYRAGQSKVGASDKDFRWLRFLAAIVLIFLC